MNEENNFNNGVNPNPQPGLTTVQMNALSEQPVQPVTPVQPAPVQPVAPNKGNNNKLLIVVLLAVLLVGAGTAYYFLVLKKGNTSGSGSNTSNSNTSTTIGDYKESDVGLRCTMSKTTEKGTATMTVELLYNYKNYAMQAYTKVVTNFNSLTDEEYYEYIDDNYGETTECLIDNTDGKACHKDHLELGITDDGMNTVIDRKGKTITTTFNKAFSIDQQATEEDKTNMKSAMEAQGFVCK